MCNEFVNKISCVKIIVLPRNLIQRAMSTVSWDPIHDSEQGTLTATASTRIKRDLIGIFNDPPPGLFVIGDESNLKIIHAIIVGVMDTPYEGGFFYFVLKCPNDYPICPPKVRLMTTDAGRVRFNPNIYSSGKVCLSILGTWSGPSWSPAQQLSSLLLSIQSLLNEKPYFNEPGIVKEQVPGDSKRYNEYIQHETLRVSVCCMMENQCYLNMPAQLKDIMEKTFLEFYDQYVEIAKNNVHLDGTELIDPFNKSKHICQYKKLLSRLEKIKGKVLGKTCNFFNEPSCSNVDIKERQQTKEEVKCTSTVA